MRYLILMSVVWAFSFPLIKHYLSGIVDNYFAILVRFLLALIVFLPFFRATKISLALKLVAIGAIQIGLMYIFYYNSFLYISAAEVALFTIFTPFYVTLMYDICTKKFHSLYLLSFGVAVLGAYIIRFGSIDSNFLIGFLLVQGANICFGAGQSLYKFVIQQEKIENQANVFGYFYVGACLVGIFAFAFFGNSEKIPEFSLDSTQWQVLIYLGVIASGVGYFLWNKGCSMCDSGVIAIMNNAMIPLVVLADWAIWGYGFSLESFVKLLIGGIVIFLSLFIHYKIINFYKARDIKARG